MRKGLHVIAVKLLRGYFICFKVQNKESVKYGSSMFMGHTPVISDVKWEIPMPAINPAALQLLISASLKAGALKRSSNTCIVCTVT